VFIPFFNANEGYITIEDESSCSTKEMECKNKMIAIAV
jgi:hypothetical protein